MCCSGPIPLARKHCRTAQNRHIYSPQFVMTVLRRSAPFDRSRPTSAQVGPHSVRDPVGRVMVAAREQACLRPIRVRVRSSVPTVLKTALRPQTRLVVIRSAFLRTSSLNLVSAGPMISASIVSTSLSTDEYSMGSNTHSRYLIHKSCSMANGSSPSSMMGRNGTMISGTVACSSSGGDFGLVMSAMTNFDSPASSRTVSVKSLVWGLSKLKTIGRYRLKRLNPQR
jgi:hypothetical protein